MTTADELNSIVDFDIPFMVENHEVFTGPIEDEGHRRIYAPEVFFNPDAERSPKGYNDLDISSTENWEPLIGFSNQYSYRGACLHQSELLAGGLAEHVLENDGIYVVVAVYSYDEPSVPSENGYGAEPDSWAILKLKES